MSLRGEICEFIVFEDEDLPTYILECLEAGFSLKEIQDLKSIFNYQDFWTINFIKDLKRIKKVYPYKYIMIIYFMIYTGLPLKDILKLKWLDIATAKGLKDRIKHRNPHTGDLFNNIILYSFRDKLTLYLDSAKRNNVYGKDMYIFLKNIETYYVPAFKPERHFILNRNINNRKQTAFYYDYETNVKSYYKYINRINRPLTPKDFYNFIYDINKNISIEFKYKVKHFQNIYMTYFYEETISYRGIKKDRKPDNIRLISKNIYN